MTDNYYVAYFPWGDTAAEFAGSLTLFGPLGKTAADALSKQLYNELSKRSDTYKQETMGIVTTAIAPWVLPKDICEEAGVPEGSYGYDVFTMADMIDKVCGRGDED